MVCANSATAKNIFTERRTNFNFMYLFFLV
jgi:hypothetical protein